MAERKIGTVPYWHNLSSVLAIFRLSPAPDSKFPPYKAGQYIALRRDDCKLTRKSVSVDGRVEYVPDLDEKGVQKVGPVTHSYSISSAPFETEQKGYLEFYVILEKNDSGHPGRLTESLFRMDPKGDNQLVYVDRITGDFTLEKRCAGFRNVLMVGTGTGLAPFAGMIKQKYYEACEGKTDGVGYTLLHTNRTYEELGYHEELLKIQASGKLDFIYLPSVSRPTPRDRNDQGLSVGRANNLLRVIFGMPLKEEQELQAALERGENGARERDALERTVRPQLSNVSAAELQKRLEPSSTVILTCGNPYSMADIKFVADANKIRFEKEDW